MPLRNVCLFVGTSAEQLMLRSVQLCLFENKIMDFDLIYFIKQLHYEILTLKLVELFNGNAKAKNKQLGFNEIH